MIRRRVAEQTRMRRGRWGWELARPDKTVVQAPFLRNSRITERLMREILQDSDLRITYHRVLVDNPNGPEKTLAGLVPPRTAVVLPEPVDEPAEWSPFDAHGRLDEARLKREGWHPIRPLNDEG